MDTIEIKQSDLDSPEKLEAFRQVFGRSHIHNAKLSLSEQRFGDGTKEAIESRMAVLDINDPSEFAEYESLREKQIAASAKLKSKEDAVYHLQLNPELQDQIFSNRDVAKSYLGERRYYDAVFGTNREAVTDRELQEYNPHLREHKKQEANFKEQLRQLEEQRKRLLARQIKETNK